MVKELDEALVALAEPTRRRVVELLRESPRSAGELAERAAMSPAAMSRHLRVLRRSGLVDDQRDERDARLRIYRLRPERFVALQAWLDGMKGFWAEQMDAFRRYADDYARGGQRD
jgi:DNA-binding transcriptional ArsR family regulator